MVVGEETTDEQLAVGVVGAVRLWYQSPAWLPMVMVAELCVTLLASSVSLAGCAASEASDGGLWPTLFSARTLNWYEVLLVKPVIVVDSSLSALLEMFCQEPKVLSLLAFC